MKLNRLLLALAVIVLGLATAPSQDAKRDDERLRGTWEVISLVEGGKEMPDQKGQTTITFLGKGKLRVKVKDQTSEGTYKLDPSRSPKWVEMSKDGDTFLGIYELKGDTLRLCFATGAGKERPTRFESRTDGPATTFAVLKRVKE